MYVFNNYKYKIPITIMRNKLISQLTTVFCANNKI